MARAGHGSSKSIPASPRRWSCMNDPPVSRSRPLTSKLVAYPTTTRPGSCRVVMERSGQRQCCIPPLYCRSRSSRSPAGKPLRCHGLRPMAVARRSQTSPAPVRPFPHGLQCSPSSLTGRPPKPRWLPFAGEPPRWRPHGRGPSASHPPRHRRRRLMPRVLHEIGVFSGVLVKVLEHRGGPKVE